MFASLSSDDRLGGRHLPPTAQQELIRLHPEVFRSASGAWGRQGWTTLRLSAADAATVRGAITRTPAGIWTLNAIPQTGLDDCAHLDLAFTPATNLTHVRVLDLAEGQSVDVPAAWLDMPCLALARLPQRYARRTKTTVWYEAPSVGYAAELAIQPSGFVRDYPGLWEADG